MERTLRNLWLKNRSNKPPEVWYTGTMVPLDKASVLAAIRSGSGPDEDLPLSIKALWHDKTGDWVTAHDLCQAIADPAGARIHAYLHRVEGDISNARYWYRRAGEEMPSMSLDDEWDELLDRAVAGAL